jgi:hypothetical protein
VGFLLHPFPHPSPLLPETQFPHVECENNSSSLSYLGFSLVGGFRKKAKAWIPTVGVYLVLHPDS